MSRFVAYIIGCALGMLIAIGSTPSRADYIVNHAVLHCDDSGVTVRFGESHNNNFPIMLYDLPSERAALFLRGRG